jgi:LPXTG-motif cell wall-anchored protein
MSVRNVTKKRLVAGTAIALPLGIVAAGAASATDAPAPLGGLSAVSHALNTNAANTNVLHGITDLAVAKQLAPAQAPVAKSAAAPAPAANPITAAAATIVNATQNTPLAALLPQASAGKHRAENPQPTVSATQQQAGNGKHRMPKHKKADAQPLDAVTGNLGGTVAKVADLQLVNHTLDGVTEQLGLGHTLTDALKPVTGNGGLLSGLLNVKERTAVQAQHQARHARPATSLVDDSALPHTGGDAGEIALLLGAGLALTAGGAGLVTRRRRHAANA